MKMIGFIFHGIGVPQRELEPGEDLYWISEGFFEAILQMMVPRADHVQISFDDGNSSDHTIALPRLQALGLQADFFPLTGRIGQLGSMTAEQICDLAAAGMGVGSHGVDHQNWAKISVDMLEKEITQSRKVLEEIIHQPVTAAAIPFGSYNSRVLGALRQAGYDTAYSSDQGSMRMDRFLRPRTSVRRDMDMADVKRVLDGQMSILGKLRWLAGITLKSYIR